MVELHLLGVNADFRYDPIFALGTVTAFDRFMQGYHPEAEQAKIFNALTEALSFDPGQLRRDADQLLALVPSYGGEALLLLTHHTGDEEALTDLKALLQAVAANLKFKYSRLFAIGLFTLLQAAAPQQMTDDSQRKALIAQVGERLKLSDDKLSKDLDLYRANLEKVEQARQVMDDILAADRKKRNPQAAAASNPEETPSETAP